MSRCSHPAWSSVGQPRVTVLTQLFPPETQAGANRLEAMVDALAGDFEVTVVTLYPSYPTPEFFRKREWKVREDDGKAYRVCRVMSFEPHAGSFIRRGARELLMAHRLGWHARTLSTDLVVATSPSFFLGPFGLLVARWKRVPFVWDIRDVTWRYVADHDDAGAMLRTFGRTMRWCAGFIGRRSSLVVGSNPGIVAEMAGLGIRSDHTAHVPNGVSRELLDACIALEPTEDRTRPRVTYAGALGYYQGLEVLVDVAGLMPHCDFVLAGDGPERTNLEDKASEKALENVEFRGYMDRDSLLRLYADSDILYASLRDLASLNEYTFPSKPFEYMAVGRPLVYAGSGLAAEFVTLSGAGTSIPWSDPLAIADRIEELIRSPSKRRAMGFRASQVARSYEREATMRAFAEDLRSMTVGT